jgi:hypothetical protein
MNQICQSKIHDLFKILCFLGILAMIANIKLIDISDRLFNYLLPIFANKPPIAIFEWKTYLSNSVVMTQDLKSFKKIPSKTAK